MPLFADGLKKIRRNLMDIQAGKRVDIVRIGVFTEAQLRLINDRRNERGHLPLKAVIVFVGRHLHRSRCDEVGYCIEEVLLQISSAFGDDCDVECGRGTVLVNRRERIDSLGNKIRDEAVFECTQKHPFAELWSVIPRGDGKNHTQK